MKPEEIKQNMAAKTFDEFYSNYLISHDVPPPLPEVWNAATELAEEKFNSAPAANQQLEQAIAALSTLSGEVATINRIAIKDRLNNIIQRLQRSIK